MSIGRKRREPGTPFLFNPMLNTADLNCRRCGGTTSASRSVVHRTCTGNVQAFAGLLAPVTSKPIRT
jgi:hypothetical protein